MVEFIAEFTTNHMGNLNLALEMAHKAKDFGATRIKMQKKNIETSYTQEKLDRSYVSPYGYTYREYRKIFEFDIRQMDIFDSECRSLDIPWYATVQDPSSLYWMLENFPNVDRYKFASSNLRNVEFLSRASKVIPRNLEIVLSTAGASLEEMETALSYFRNHKKIWLLHCVAEYPCDILHLKLGNIPILKKTFGDDRIRIGYSGHEKGGNVIPALVAVSLGAEMVERHFCLSRHSFVHHIDCSMTPEEFEVMVGACSSPLTEEEVSIMLPPSSLDSSFRMSKMEESFLLNQTYGDDYLEKESSLNVHRTN